jgi:hypothetical protein
MENAIEQAPAELAPSIEDSGSSFLASLDAAFSNIGDGQFGTPTPEDTYGDGVDTQAEGGDTYGDEAGTQAEGDFDTEVDDAEVEEKDFLSSDDDTPTDWTPKAAHRFQQLKAELKQHRADLATLRQEKVTYESQLQELKGVAESKDYEALEQRVKEYEQRNMLADLESTDIFRESVAEPIERLVGQARAIAERYDVDADELLDAFALDDEAEQEAQLDELLAGASDRDKARIYRIIEDLNPVFERRADLYKNVEEALNEAKFVEEERSNAQAAERMRERTQVSKVVAERLMEKVPFLSSFEGVDLQKIAAAAAEVDPSAAGAVDNTYNAISGKLFPTFVKEYAALQKELDVLTERLASYQKAEPGFDASGGSPQRGGTDDDEVGLGEALRRALGQ